MLTKLLKSSIVRLDQRLPIVPIRKGLAMNGGTATPGIAALRLSPLASHVQTEKLSLLCELISRSDRTGRSDYAEVLARALLSSEGGVIHPDQILVQLKQGIAEVDEEAFKEAVHVIRALLASAIGATPYSA